MDAATPARAGLPTWTWRQGRATGLWWLALALALLVTVGPARAATPGLRFGWDSLMMGAVSPAEGQAATRVWVRVLVKRGLADKDPSVTVYESSAALRSAVASKRADLVVVSTPLYLTMPEAKLLTPRLMSINIGSKEVGEKFVLLARSALAGRGVKGLRGKRVLVVTAGQGGVPQLWLEVVLRRAGLGPARRFFGEVRQPQKASGAVLPTFFGSADCCVVTRAAYENACALNPQVAAGLKVVAESQRIPFGVLCEHKASKASAADKQRNERALLGLHNYPEGRSIMMLFGICRTVPFAESHFTGARALVAECRRLGVSTATVR